MLRWGLIFIAVALVGGFFGFAGMAGASIEIAKVQFFVFITLFAILLIAGPTVARKITGF